MNTTQNKLKQFGRKPILWFERVLGPHWKQILKWTGIGLVAAAVTTIVVAGIGIYALGWQNRFTIDVSRFIPYPALWADNHMISYHHYAMDAQSLKIYQQQVHKIDRTKQSPSQRALNQQAYQQQVNRLIVQKYADRHSIIVSDEEVLAQMNNYFTDQGSEQVALKFLKTSYGWSKGDFADQVRAQLLYTKVAQAIAADPEALNQAHLKAVAIYKQAMGGTDFTYLQQRYSVHPTATETGDQMLVAASNLPTELAAPIAKLADGQVVGQVIKSGSAYYILKREKTLGGVAQVRLIEVLPPGASGWLASEYQKAHVIKLLPQLRGL